MLTFDGYNQLWDDREDLLGATTSQQVLYSLKRRKKCKKIFERKKFPSLEKYQVTSLNLNSKEDVRVLCFPESVKEEGEVVVVVQGLKGYLIVELKNDITVSRKLMQDVIQKERWR